MLRQIRVVLFSEVNSKLGAPFLAILAAHPVVTLCAVVTSPVGRLCTYFLDEEDPVDLESQAGLLRVPVVRPDNVNAPNVRARMRQFEADYFVIGNYQQILAPETLMIPEDGTINFHPSPLPRYAGWAPFFWMARNGERHSGVTAIKATPEIDGGPIIAQQTIKLTGAETALEIRESHTVATVALLRRLLPRLVAGPLSTRDQDPAERTYFGKPADRHYWIDFGGDVESVLRVIRAGYRRPGAYAVTEAGRRVVILSADRAEVELPELARPGETRCVGNGLYAAATDGWVRLWSIEVDGVEAPPDLAVRPQFMTCFAERMAA
jgi:methionyl-tRNA formyltransferase